MRIYANLGRAVFCLMFAVANGARDFKSLVFLFFFPLLLVEFTSTLS